MELVIKRYDEMDKDELYEVLRVRVAVFVVEQSCPYQELDGLDAQSVHVFLRKPDGEVVAYLRMFERSAEPGCVQIGRVLTTCRGGGLGARVLDAGIGFAFGQMGAVELYLESQVYAKGFYERVGFAVAGEQFDEDGIPHVPMRLKRPPDGKAATCGD